MAGARPRVPGVPDGKHAVYAGWVLEPITLLGTGGVPCLGVKFCCSCLVRGLRFKGLLATCYRTLVPLACEQRFAAQVSSRMAQTKLLSVGMLDPQRRDLCC